MKTKMISMKGIAACGMSLAIYAPGALGNPHGDETNFPATLNMIHPGFTVDTLKLAKRYSVMGVDFLSNGDLVMTTCDSKKDGGYEGGGVPDPTANAGVFIISNATGGSPTIRQIASMFRMPSGSVVVNDTIYVSDRDAFYRINSLTPADITRNRSKVITYPIEARPAGFSNDDYNFGYWHQYIFCPSYYNGRFYAVYSGTIKGGGDSDNPPSTSYSGSYLSWTRDSTQGFQKVAGGFRSPNGGNIGPGGMLMVTDNQGGWVPSCPLMLIKPGKFYGHRQNAGFAPNWAQAAADAGTMKYEPPVAWFLDGSAGGMGQSTAQPMYMDRGPFAGDWIVGDDNSRGIARVSLDPVNGGTGVTANYNGAVMFFTHGLDRNADTTASPNRMTMHPTQNTLLIGTLGTLGNWPVSNAQPFYTVKFDDAAVAGVFEIKSVHSRADGIEIRFTQPINPATAVAGSFVLKHFKITRKTGYGDGNDAIPAPAIRQVLVSADAKRIFLQVGNIADTDRVLKITAAGIRSATGGSPFFNQTIFTHNWQSTEAFNAATRIVDRAPVDRFMENHIAYRKQAGSLIVNVTLPGDYSVSLRTLNGSRVEEATRLNQAEYTFAGAHQGMFILQVAQGTHAYCRPVFF